MPARLNARPGGPFGRGLTFKRIKRLKRFKRLKRLKRFKRYKSLILY
jgi:hypothetical protein